MATSLSTRGFFTFFLFLSVFLSTGPALALDPVYTGLFTNLAVDGYDPVAYFRNNRPIKGEKRFQFSWQGAVWRFSSAENRDAFQAEPKRFAPQYGGYCAWAVSQGYTASGDPEAWTIHKGKLYLNYSSGVRKRWLENVPGNIAKGDGNWPGLAGSPR